MPLNAEQRQRISLSDPWDFGWLAEMVEAWGFRMMQERGHFADRHEVAQRWFEQEYVPVSEMLAEGGLTERGETETDAYMRLAGQRYLLLRTHEWSDEVIDQLRAATTRSAAGCPRRRRRGHVTDPAPWVADWYANRLLLRARRGHRCRCSALPRPDSERRARRASGRLEGRLGGLRTQAHHAAGTVKGAAHAVTPHRHEQMDDATLADRVRSEIFRDADAPKGGVSVDVQAGVAYLRGEVPDERVDRAPRQGHPQGPGHRQRQEPAARARHADADRRAAFVASENFNDTSTSRAPGWPSPGHGASTISSRASLVALTAWRSWDRRPRQCPAPPRLPAELDLAVDHDDVGALVHLVLLQLLAGRQVDQDRPRLTARGMQDLRLVRLDFERAQVPVLHGAERYASARPLRAAARSPGG